MLWTSELEKISCPSGFAAATIEQLAEAHARFEGFGKAGEFALARREGGQVVWVLSHRREGVGIPRPISFNGPLAEPVLARAAS